MTPPSRILPGDIEFHCRFVKHLRERQKRTPNNNPQVGIQAPARTAHDAYLNS